MTDVPQIVYYRLRAAEQPPQAHPEANLLSSFAEQKLSVTERDGLLEHLSGCADCREVIALALPAAEVTAAPQLIESENRAAAHAAASRKLSPHKLSFFSFVWPGLRWAALAAGVAVAASMLLFHPGKLNQASNSPANKAVTASDAQTALSSTARIATPPTSPTPQTLSSNVDVAGRSVAVSNGRIALGERKKLSPGVAKFSRNQPTDLSETSPSATVAHSSERSLLAQNEAPAIEKAKPVPQQIVTQSMTPSQPDTGAATAQPESGNRSASVTGRNVISFDAIPAVTLAITDGVLQRSVDNGQSWQNTLRADHPLSCYAANGDEMWAGGQAGSLFHSIDAGVTWTKVRPSIDGQPLSNDITELSISRDNSKIKDISPSDPGADKTQIDALKRADLPAVILVFTSNKQIWISRDDGISWTKKEQ